MSFNVDRLIDVVLGYLWFTAGVLTVIAVVIALTGLVLAVIHHG